MNAAESNEFRLTLQQKADDYGVAVSNQTLDVLTAYYEFLSSWNSRLHLVAPTSPQEFATRHVLESLLLLKHLPTNSSIADIGSGGGLPIIPNLIARSDIQAVLIESSKKKGVFLREVLNHLGLSSRATVIAERFENVDAPNVDVITSRALERFERIVPKLVEWAPKRALFLFFGGPLLAASLEKANLKFKAELIPNSKQRFLYVARLADPS